MWLRSTALRMDLRDNAKPSRQAALPFGLASNVR